MHASLFSPSLADRSSPRLPKAPWWGRRRTDGMSAVTRAWAAGASVPTRRQETSQGLRHLRRHDRGRGVAQDAGGLEVGPYEGDAARAAGDVRVHDAPV